MPNSETQALMIQDYREGARVSDICREHGIGQRHFYQILKNNGVEKRPAVSYDKDAPLSKVHQRIGTHLRTYYFHNGFDRRLAANKLGWSSLRLKRVETGSYDLTLFDLQDIAEFTRTSIGDLVNGS